MLIEIVKVRVGPTIARRRQFEGPWQKPSYSEPPAARRYRVAVLYFRNLDALCEAPMMEC